MLSFEAMFSAIITLIGIYISGVVAVALSRKKDKKILLVLTVVVIGLLIVTVALYTGEDDTDFGIDINSISLQVEEQNGNWLHLSLSGCDGKSLQWESSDVDVAVVDDYGTVTAVSTGVAEISVMIKGSLVKKSLPINVTLKNIEMDSGSLRYLEKIPSGINQEHDAFTDMSEEYSISGSKEEVFASLEQSLHSEIKEGVPELIGYVYWHWCRGMQHDYTEDYDPYDNDLNPHNRLSFPESRVVDVNNDGNTRDDYFTKFSCFFSDRYLSTEDMYFDRDTDVDGYYGRSMWYPWSGVCYDSYWYWFTPVYESEYTIYEPELSISIID